MKKIIFLLTGIICLCGVLSGCSSNNSTRTNDEQAKEDGMYVYNEEAQISEIALSFSLKNISPTGATLVFDQYDADSPKGELMYGEDFERISVK